MQFTYFKADQNTTIEDIKRQYRVLALKLHPDMGGDLKAMQQLNAEWDYLKAHNFNMHETMGGGRYRDMGQTAPDSVTEEFSAIIEQLIKMEGVIIEVCGSFLWLSGSTYDHKAEIKAMGFRWAGKKKRWFLAPKDWRKKSRHELTMGEIRDTYGSQMVGTGHKPQGFALTA